MIEEQRQPLVKQLISHKSNRNQARRKEFYIGEGAESRCDQSEQKLGSEGLRPGIFFTTTPFRSFENAPFSKNCH